MTFYFNMRFYFNMKELSRSIVFKRIKLIHNQKQKITIDTTKITLQQLLTHLGR